MKSEYPDVNAIWDKLRNRFNVKPEDFTNQSQILDFLVRHEETNLAKLFRKRGSGFWSETQKLTETHEKQAKVEREGAENQKRAEAEHNVRLKREKAKLRTFSGASAYAREKRVAVILRSTTRSRYVIKPTKTGRLRYVMQNLKGKQIRVLSEAKFKAKLKQKVRRAVKPKRRARSHARRKR